MAMFVLSINALSGGGKRRGERQQILAALATVGEALGGGAALSGNILDVNRSPGVDAAVVGTWVYSPVATGDT